MSSDSSQINFESTQRFDKLKQDILAKYERGELTEVKASTRIPSFYINKEGERIEIKINEVSDFLHNLIYDPVWWSLGIESCFALNDKAKDPVAEGALWNQNLRLVITPRIKHHVEAIKRISDGNAQMHMMRSVALPHEDSSLHFSYIADYIVEEEIDPQTQEKYYKFTLVGHIGMKVPAIFQKPLEAIVKIITPLFMANLKGIFGKGKYIDIKEALNAGEQ